MTRNELWDRFAAAGLVRGDMPGEAGATPWYVAAMVGFAAWIASIFLLVFLGIAVSGLFREGGGMIMLGVVLCAMSVVAMRVRRSVFVEQMALAVSLAGQALIGVGIVGGEWRSPGAWLVFAAVEATLVALGPLYVHRVLATLVAAYAVRFALAHAGLGGLFPALIAGAFVLAWASPARNDGLRLPVTAGLALAALLVVPASLVDIFAWGGRGKPAVPTSFAWIATLALAGVLLATVARLLREMGAGFQSRPAVVALAAAAAAALAAAPMPGLVVALIVLLVAFGEGRRALMGLAIAGMIGALVHYYYALDATLLEKSGALLATGVVLIVAGIAVRVGLADGEPRHA